MLVSPHAGHSFARTWYSVTTGGGGGAASKSCRFCSQAAGTSARSCPQQPHAAGPHFTVLSGLPDCFSVEDCAPRSEEHTSVLQSPVHLVCRLLLEKKKKKKKNTQLKKKKKDLHNNKKKKKKK